MLERDIVTAIKKYLASLGSDVFFWKEHGGPYGYAGIPDVICLSLIHISGGKRDAGHCTGYSGSRAADAGEERLPRDFPRPR